jgi:glycine dehydrogenase subunit 1
MRYLPLSDKDRRAMLEVIGSLSIDDLFVDVPDEGQLKAPIDLPKHQSEASVEAQIKAFANANLSPSKAPCFLGGGAYRHHIPATVDHLIQRSEFLTSYTPYQPEIAQGTLQVLFEFQTQVQRLLAGNSRGEAYIANASLYDGSTAAAEGVLMASRITQRKKAVISGGVHPHYLDTIKTLAEAVGIDVTNLAPEIDNEAAVIDHISNDLACVVVQTPNFFGTVTDVSALSQACKAQGVLLIVVITEVLSQALLKSAGEMGADIIAAEGQSIGVPLSFGGPYVGLMAAKSSYTRQMPGRLCGETVDKEGRRGFVLTLSTREQHIRRDKATSNICTNSGLCALAFSIHMSLLGQVGLKRLSRLNHAKAHGFAQKLKDVGLKILNERYFNEFVVKLPFEAEPFVNAMAEKGILAGIPVSRLVTTSDHRFDQYLLVAVTEMISDADEAAFIEAYQTIKAQNLLNQGELA